MTVSTFRLVIEKNGFRACDNEHVKSALKIKSGSKNRSIRVAPRENLSSL